MSREVTLRENETRDDDGHNLFSPTHSFVQLLSELWPQKISQQTGGGALGGFRVTGTQQTIAGSLSQLRPARTQAERADQSVRVCLLPNHLPLRIFLLARVDGLDELRV
jgi:hypothetical protein